MLFGELVKIESTRKIYLLDSSDMVLSTLIEIYRDYNYIIISSNNRRRSFGGKLSYLYISPVTTRNNDDLY